MFENIMNFFRKMITKQELSLGSKDTAKERLHLVLMQDRANVSADFLDLMRQEIIDVIKKYIEVDESAIDVRLTNKENADGTNGAPALYANIPIVNIKEEARIKEKNKTEAPKKNESQKENNIDIAKTEENKTEAKDKSVENAKEKHEEESKAKKDTETEKEATKTTNQKGKYESASKEINNKK